MPDLIVVRSEGRCLYLHVHPDADPATIVAQLQSEGIVIEVHSTAPRSTRLGIHALADVSIIREEWLRRDDPRR